MSNTIILFNKPYGVLCQFRSADERPTLSNHVKQKGFYPAGRLDLDSEGLLILTSDGGLQHRIAHPSKKLPKTYWVQVEGVPDEDALRRLRNGVELKDGRTRPAQVRRIDPPTVWERDPPIRVRKSIPDSWIELTISEGRNRQVRRMTAAVGHPTLRLIRYAIGPWTIDGLGPGESRSIDENDLPAALRPQAPRRDTRNPRRSPSGTNLRAQPRRR